MFELPIARAVHDVRPSWLCACASGGKACVLVHVCTGRHICVTVVLLDYCAGQSVL